MNAELFYNDFKNALQMLGVAWSQKDQVQVVIIGSRVRYSYGNYTVEVVDRPTSDTPFVSTGELPRVPPINNPIFAE